MHRVCVSVCRCECECVWRLIVWLADGCFGTTQKYAYNFIYSLVSHSIDTHNQLHMKPNETKPNVTKESERNKNAQETKNQNERTNELHVCIWHMYMCETNKKSGESPIGFWTVCIECMFHYISFAYTIYKTFTKLALQWCYFTAIFFLFFSLLFIAWLYFVLYYFFIRRTTMFFLPNFYKCMMCLKWYSSTRYTQSIAPFFLFTALVLKCFGQFHSLRFCVFVFDIHTWNRSQNNSQTIFFFSHFK